MEHKKNTYYDDSRIIPPSNRGWTNIDIAKRITELREEAGENRKEFSVHTGISVRTLEDWEAGRRTPPEYIPRLTLITG